MEIKVPEYQEFVVRVASANRFSEVREGASSFANVDVDDKELIPERGIRYL